MPNLQPVPYAPKFNMGKKLFNDPIYGLVDFRDEVVYELIDQPYFQRLRRIRQMGLSDYVYAELLTPRFPLLHWGNPFVIQGAGYAGIKRG